MLIYLKHLGYILATSIIGTIIITALNYIGLFNNHITNIINIIITLTGIFISSYLLGKKSKSKGYIEGLKLGSLVIIILIIINIILKTFKLPIILYYVVILLVSTLGSMIGINKKKDN